MVKGKHGICIAALVAALAAPVAWADDSSENSGFFQALLAQLEALWLGDDAVLVGASAPSTVNAEQSELGPVALPNG